MSSPSELAKQITVVDADTHFSEPWDLWTSRAPAAIKDRVPHVQLNDENKPFWYVDGDVPLIGAGGASIINREGEKVRFWDRDIMRSQPFEDLHAGAYDPKQRLALMDEQGIWAHVIYPNAIGFGAGKLLKLADRDLTKAIIQIYNDAIAEWQEQGNGRLLPQALIPFWDVDAAVAEVERAVTELKLTGITMSGEPFAGGLPDLGQPHWDPLYEICSEYEVPINIHIASSEGNGIEDRYSRVWASQDEHRRYVLGNVQVELANSNFLSNLVASDVLVRWPKLTWVSVESGIGWIPFVLERIDYQLQEALPDDPALMRESATELFRKHVLACFWFEDSAPRSLLNDIGVDNVMFETDYPHPTCLYPNPVEYALERLKGYDESVIRKVMGGNAARIYKIQLPD